MADARKQAAGPIQQRTTSGDKLVTVQDTGYPLNLRQVRDRPPFLFVRGSLREQDGRVIAVVGTLQPSDVGLRLARQLASELATRGVTVVSGLARGIDAVAHQGALDARGRTLAVLGAGIAQPISPISNRGTAERIVDAGALVSQLWPIRPQDHRRSRCATSSRAGWPSVRSSSRRASGGAAHQALTS